MSTISTTAAHICKVKNALARDRKALAYCSAEDEHTLDENIACWEETLAALEADFEEQAKNTNPAAVRHLRHAIKANHIESLVAQMAHL